jgi:hypothetical protein
MNHIPPSVLAHAAYLRFLNSLFDKLRSCADDPNERAVIHYCHITAHMHATARWSEGATPA